MNARFAAVRRSATAALSRRASLIALGGAAFVSVARPRTTRAGKAGKKARRKCKRQAAQCRAAFVDICDTNQDCTDLTNVCCAYFSRCHAGAAVRCLTQLG